mmetsp:Transcript_31114/g.52405  ORF Transcript_31114/g.52405 Transcript_31114/m.52405 type:complete len:147 (+) Transcript_31114:181-621(+)
MNEDIRTKVSFTGVCHVCMMVNDAFQAQFIDEHTFENLGLFGIPRPVKVNPCCRNPDDPIFGYEITVIRFGTGEEASLTAIKSGGDIFHLKGPQINFDVQILKTGDDASKDIARFFPKMAKIAEVSDALVCVGAMQIDDVTFEKNS